jgi:phosphorylcholine metabolism protein LicD
LDDEAALVSNLRDVKAVFDAAGIVFWLDYGTLLGVVREKRILPWETDIDLGILSENWNRIREVIPHLLNIGFYVALTEAPIHGEERIRFMWMRRYGVNFDILVYKVDSKNAVAFDVADDKGSTNLLIRAFRWTHLLLDNSIYFATNRRVEEHVLFDYVFRTGARFLRLIPEQDRKKLASTAWRLRPVLGVRVARFVVPKRFFKRLKTVHAYGLEFHIPLDVDEYLSCHYGDWRTPNEKWEWRNDRTIDTFF